MENIEIEKGKCFVVAESIEYVPSSVSIKTIIGKTTGNINLVSVDAGESLTEKTSPFDTLLQLIEGKAEVLINDVSVTITAGQAIIIPSHARNSMKAHVRFKMVSTVIKSGYEAVSA